MKKILCKLGFHKYGRAHFIDQFGSNALDYKQKCSRCGHIIRWTQPKGADYRYYPVYWGKRKYWVYALLLLTIIVILTIIRAIFL